MIVSNLCGTTFVITYLTDPPKKMAMRQDIRPKQTTANCLFFPYCHIILAYSTDVSGSSSSRLCQTRSLVSLFGADWFLGLGFEWIDPSLSVCGTLSEDGLSDNSQTDVATKKAHIMKARARSSMTPRGEETEEEPWRTENKKNQNDITVKIKSLFHY